MAYPLEGINVLELSKYGSIPVRFCTISLSARGAKVTSIKHPSEKALINDPFLYNKEVIGLNLRHDEAKEILHKLAHKSDVFIEGFRPGKAEELGADYETLSSINPKIIYCSITAYGQDSPYRDIPAHDINCVSLAGAVSLTGDNEGNPVVIGPAIADIGSAKSAESEILYALIDRQKTGKGKYIDISMANSALPYSAVTLARLYEKGSVPPRGRLSTRVALYKTKDGKYISTGLVEPEFVKKFCYAIGAPEIQKYMTSAKKQNKKTARKLIEKTLLTKTRDEWFEIFKKAGVPAAPVLELDEVMNNPHFLQHGYFKEGIGDMLLNLSTPIKPPKLDIFPKFMDEILLELGYNTEKIKDMYTSGAIFW